MRRSRDASSEAAFVEAMKNHDWSLMTGDADDMANHLEETINRLTDVHFPLERSRRRSTEHPWINRTIRKLWKKKIRIYKKGGKSDEWWSTDRVLQQKLEEARLGFVERLLEDGTKGRSFYAATKSLSSAAPAGKWQVSDMFPGVGPAEVGKEVLRYYSGICTDPVNPVEGVSKRDGGLGTFTEERTTELLRNAKKTDSRVDGDPLAHMVRRYPEAFVEPVSGIFNKINKEGIWPKSWKTEHITVIPKNPNPADLSECRNISCTSAFSKILEGVVLLQLREEIERDDSQFGGVPKCGAEHMLIGIWEEVLDALEGGKNAAVLLGVDYEKAFNRMGHAECLKQLRELGASPGSLSLVRSFLEGRTMTISIDGCKAAPVSADRGSPQGSVLGCYLYCATTRRLTTKLRQGSNLPKAFLYVDDTTLLDVVSMESAVRHITTGTTKEEFRELELGADFGVLVGRAEDIGMKINDKKTQLLVVSPQNGCLTTGSITTAGGDAIDSVDRLRLVGFTFGDQPGAGPHVDSIREAYAKKKWLLFHLRDAGFGGEALYKLYCCYVRSVIEYCSVAYHSLLTSEQSEALERIQRHALRVCFGCQAPINEVMQEYAIDTLGERRRRRCDAFIQKNVRNPRFGPVWFPPREGDRGGLRERREIQEGRATTTRRFNSPLSFLRRRANEMGVEPGR